MRWKYLAVLDRVYVIGPSKDLIQYIGPFDTREKLITYVNAIPELKDAQVEISCVSIPD